MLEHFFFGTFIALCNAVRKCTRSSMKNRKGCKSNIYGLLIFSAYVPCPQRWLVPIGISKEEGRARVNGRCS